MGGWLDYVVIKPPQPSQAEARQGFWLGWAWQYVCTQEKVNRIQEWPKLPKMRLSFWSYSSAVCQALLKSVRNICVDPTPTKILLLSLNVDRPKQFCVIWLISSTLMHVWELHMSKKSTTLIETRAVLEAKINLLRKSRRLYNEATLIEELLINFN